MKYLLTLSLLLVTIVGGIAQDKTAAEYKNEGNTALRAKNYKLALENYEKAIANWNEGEEMDASMVYNTGYCALKSKDYEKAVKYYSQAKELNYKPDGASFFIAYAYKAMGNEDEMEKVLSQALKDYPDSKYVGKMKKMLVTYYLKEGAVPYNEASKILATAASADPSQYDAITAKANAKFEQAKPYFEKVLSIDPNNESAKKSLGEINDRLSGKKS